MLRLILNFVLKGRFVELLSFSLRALGAVETFLLPETRFTDFIILRSISFTSIIYISKFNNLKLSQISPIWFPI